MLSFAVFAVITIVYMIYSVWQWNTFRVVSWDLGIFTQMYQSYTAGSAPIVTIKGVGFNLLGDHFHPLLVVFTPVFWLFPNPFTLLVLQNICFGTTAGIVTWAAYRKLGAVPGLVLGLACGLSWGLQYAAEAQFHEVALAAPLLAASLAAVLDRRWVWACGWAAFLPFVKEDLGLTVIVIGLLLFILGQRRMGLALAAWGSLWFIVAVFVILPALNVNNEWAYSQSILGQAGQELSSFQPQKWVTILLLVAVSAGFVFRSRISLVLIPTLAWRFLSSTDFYWGPEWHYSAVLMPIIFLAMVDGIAKARDSRFNWQNRWSRLGPAFIAIACVLILLTKPTPLENIGEPGLFEPDSRAQDVTEILALIPPGTAVESDISLMNYLVASHRVYWIGNTNPIPDYILVGPSGGTPEEWGNAQQVAELRYPGVEYRLVTERSGYSVAERVVGSEE